MWILNYLNDYENQKSILSQYRFSYHGKYHGIKYFLHLGYRFQMKGNPCLGESLSLRFINCI